MKLEDQVCSLELAKKLKDLGVEQESIFHWYQTEYDWIISDEQYDGTVSAFTVAELGDVFPPNVQLPFKRTSTTASGDTIEIWYWSKSDARVMEGTEADARAKMLVNLLENNLLPSPTHSV